MAKGEYREKMKKNAIEEDFENGGLYIRLDLVDEMITRIENEVIDIRNKANSETCMDDVESDLQNLADALY